MGILSRLEEQRGFVQTGHPRDPVIAELFGANRSATGMSVTPDTAMRVTAVYRAVSILAQTYASLPIGVYRLLDNGGKERDRKHPLDAILTRKPNRWQTSFEWREMMSGHFALRGRCYSEVISTGGQGVSELIPLHPDRVLPFRAPDGRLAFRYTPSDGPARTILQHEMHFMHGLITGDDGVTPLSPIGVCREAIGLALATEEHGARLFGNGTRLGGVLKMPGRLKDDAARTTLLKSWKEAYSGVRNTGRTALLEDGMEWQALGMTNEDAQFLESRKMQIAEIGRIFGVPLHMLSELDRSTNNNIEHQGIEFVTHTIRPGAVRREEAMERDLLSGRAHETHCIWFDLDGLLRGDSAARGSFNSAMLQNGVFSRNEVRISEGKNPSEADGMNDYTVQTNMAMIQLLDTLNKAAGQQSKGNANGNQD
jgi:HK97 family phage portal protein